MFDDLFTPLRPLRKPLRSLPTGLAPLKLCEGEQAGLRLSLYYFF